MIFHDILKHSVSRKATMNPRQMKEYKAQQAKKREHEAFVRNQERMKEEVRRAELERMSEGEYKGRWSVTRHAEFPIGSAGDCYEKMVETYKKLGNLGARMMLGETRSMAGEWRNFDCGRGMPLWHCWVEYRDMVYDTSQGQNILMPTEMYYKAFRVQTAMDYPTDESAPKVTEEGLSWGIRIPSPRQLEFVRNIIRKQWSLGRREFPDDVSAILRN